MEIKWKEILPMDLCECLEKENIKEKEFLYAARYDMNRNRHYTQGYTVLLKNHIITARLSKEEKSVQLLGGFPKSLERDKEKTRKWELTQYSLKDIDKLEIQMLVSGGLLYATIKEQEQCIANFTNTCMGEMKRLIKIYDKLKADEEIKEEDLEEKTQEGNCPKCGNQFPNKDRKICPKCNDKRSVFFRMLAYFTPYKLKLGIMILCYIGTALLNLAWPYLNGKILYDRVLAKDNTFLEFLQIPGGRFMVLLGGVVITMLLTSLTIQVLGIIQGVLTSKIVPEVVKEIKSNVFRAMGKLSVSFYSKKQTGGLMTRVLHDAEHVTDFYINGLPYFFINVLTILCISVVMLIMNWVLAVSALVLLPLLTIISMKMLPRLWNLHGKRYRATRGLNSQINDNITGARVVKAFGQEESELKRFTTYNTRVKRTDMALVDYNNRYNALYTIVQNIATFIVWGVGSTLVLSRTELHIGFLITFVGYVSQLRGPLDFMARIVHWWAESINSSQRIFEIVDAVPEIQEVSNPVPLKNMRGEISLKNVTFGYEPHKPVLKNISFQIEEGKMLGIVGRSGAGKSTLVNLISRLYDVEEGEILIDGINVKELAFQDLRKNIAMVSQETYLFMGTVAQNIAYARPSASSEEIIRAAILASAHDFICKMPDGYDTMIGSSGRDLSGGERQRISIARAILADPKILILDEATASVDTETEQAIQASLAFLVKGRTTLSIAHRLSTLKDADRLVVIDDGKLTEEGTHSELIALEGTYFKLMELQTKALALRGIE